MDGDSQPTPIRLTEMRCGEGRQVSGRRRSGDPRRRHPVMLFLGALGEV